MSERNTTALSLAFIILLSLIVFFPVLGNGFVNWDDPEFLTQNADVLHFSWDNTFLIFKKHLTGQFAPVVPLSIWTYSLEHHFFGFNPFVYHLDNLLLHLLNTLLAFIFLQLLFKNTHLSLITSLLFAVHPLHVEPVAWATSRKDVLFAFFYLLAMISYLKFKRPQKGRLWYWFSVLFAAISLCAKGTAVTLPLILLLIDYSRNLKFKWEFFQNKIPFFLLSFLFGFLTLYANKHSLNWPDPFPTSAQFHFWQKPLLACAALFQYLLQIIFPLKLSPMYPMPIKDGAIMPQYVLTIICLIGIFYFIFQKKQTDMIYKFGFSFFICALLPVIHLLDIDGSLTYDRFAYLPLLGIMLIISQLYLITLKNIKKTKLWIVAIECLIIYVAFFSILTFRQSSVWKNSETLWVNTLQKFPNAQVAYNNLGLYYFTEGNHEKALASFNSAIYYKLDYASAHYNRGVLFEHIKNFPEAIEAYDFALLADPNYVNAMHNRGGIYFYQQKYEMALNDYNWVLQKEPDKINTIINRGMLYYQLKQFDLAILDFQRANKLEPGNQVVINKIREILGVL